MSDKTVSERLLALEADCGRWELDAEQFSTELASIRAEVEQVAKMLHSIKHYAPCATAANRLAPEE